MKPIFGLVENCGARVLHDGVGHFFTALRGETMHEARFGARERAGMVFVDGVEIGEVTDVALRDRRMLSADGIFIVVATIAEQDGRSVADPEVICRGVPFLDEAGDLTAEIRATVAASLARAAEEEIRELDLLQRVLHDDLAALIYERLRRRPMVLPVVVEV